MTKQELAKNIWEAANKLRGSIDATEYKDYILGFIFYKYLCEKEETYLANEGMTKEEYETELTLDNQDIVNYCKNNIGYFIPFSYLFSYWLENIDKFSVAVATDALNSFDNNIHDKFKNVYYGILSSLKGGLGKLGANAGAQTSAIVSILDLVKEVPTNSKDYDILGYVYQYLLTQFASKAGKKGGEFYTPHEVSKLMSRIIAYELRDANEIQIFDSCSGSGSLLINIGSEAEKYDKNLNPNSITYYAQEKMQSTYNLSRMNLIMKGINKENIKARCADTLEDDWPYIDEYGNYAPVFVNAVVSNPPYSAHWIPREDERNKNYGIAPKSKADYAFLLHDLYHLRGDGIMAIVLPHGVLFRGSSEAQIRKNLIQAHNIDTIIGLPANIFFGTGIPTIIVILKKDKKNDSNILFIDASKCFVKKDSKNALSASDIQKIFDAYVARKDIPYFSHLATYEEIEKNDFNLNIPRYISSNIEDVGYSLDCLINSGLPTNEIALLSNYWDDFPNLKSKLFKDLRYNVSSLNENYESIINNDKEVQSFLSSFDMALKEDKVKVIDLLIVNRMSINQADTFNKLVSIFKTTLTNYKHLDFYSCFQKVYDNFEIIDEDFECITKEGNKSFLIKNDYLVKEVYFKNDYDSLNKYNNEIETIQTNIEECVSNLAEDKYSVLKEDGTLGSEKLINSAIKIFKGSEIEEESEEYYILKIKDLLDFKKNINSEIKKIKKDLDAKTLFRIDFLSSEEVNNLLTIKWINPIFNDVKKIGEDYINNLKKELNKLNKKYSYPLTNLNDELIETSSEMKMMLDDLVGSEEDVKVINELKTLL